MISRCPGQDSRKIKVELIKCHSCGYKLEIFSDETGRVCPKCASRVSKPVLPTCVNWCKSARECIGEEKWKQLLDSES